MKNIEIAKIFSNIADILEIQDENPFRIRAYRKAAQNLEALTEDIEEVAKANRLCEISGIGKDLASKIEEFLKTGKVKFYYDVKKKVSSGILELMEIPGVGPKTAKTLSEKWSIKGIHDLEKKLQNRTKLKELPGIKEKTIDNILRGLEFLKKGRERTRIGIACPIANEIIVKLKKLPEVKRIEPAGSLRRMKETVRDIDILVTSDKPQKVMDVFVKLPQVRDVLAHGPTKSSVMTKYGIQVDIRVVEPDSFGAALAYFTGSKSHNIRLRELAAKKGWKLNEYGLFNEKSKRKIAGKEENDIYKALGLSFIPPQMREDAGEIELSLKKRLPAILDIKDIKGDLHVHSNYSDGSSSVEEMATAALKKGYKYIAITDHSKSLKVAGGLGEKELLTQVREIHKLNKRLKDFRILSGTEVDILSDGKLDFKDAVLKDLDYVIAAIHTGFKQPREILTRRILKAMENKYINAIAHPTGRLMGSRDAYEVDLEAIFKMAKETNTFIEINAYPDRLDLNDTFCRRAKELGVTFAIGTDSHTVEQLDAMVYGVSVAQRGWLAKKDVINTLPLDKLHELINEQ